MNTIKRITPVALFVGFLACSAQFLDMLLHGLFPPAGNLGFTCIIFLGWPTYFMSGCTPRDGVRCFAAFIAGILAGMVIFKLAGLFGFAGAAGTVFAVFLVAWLLFYYEQGPGVFNHLAACYISCGTFFMFMNYVPGATMGGAFLTEMFYLTLGLFYGWLTIAFRQWWEGRQGEKAAA